MTKRNWVRPIGLLVAVAVAGCQLIANIQSRTTDPPPQANSCGLKVNADPTLGAQIRLVNLGTSLHGGVPTQADFCVRASGTTDWGRPIFRDAGLDYPDAHVADAGHLCSQGLAYAQATVPLAVPKGKIDILAIAAGQTCTATGAKTSELDGVKAPESTPTDPAVITIVRYGGGEGKPEKLVALPEEAGQVSNTSTHLRVVNALNDPSAAINFGVATPDTLPATVKHATLADPIAPGHAASPQSDSFGAVDDQGYQDLITGTIAIGLTTVSDPTQQAFAIIKEPPAASVGTFYAIGDPLDTANHFPVRGLSCQDRAVAPDASAASETDLFQECAQTTFPSINVDSWDVSLYGANAPFADQRVQPLANFIGTRNATDLFCVTEADAKGDRETIATAAQAAGLIYTLQADSNLDTQANDPLQTDGGMPEVPKDPACAALDAGTVNAAYECAERSPTAAMPGCENDAGILVGSTNCIETNCIDQFLPFYSPNQISHQATLEDICFDCIVLNLLSPIETFKQNQTACQKTAGPVFGFGGQTPLLLLSRYPLTKTATYYYPSTGLRRGILKAQVTIPPSTTVDFFCTQLISPQIDSELPYIGPYGKDRPPGPDGGGAENGWADEQLLQAQRGVAWMKEQALADNVPAIIAGTFFSTLANSPKGGDPDTKLAALSPEVMQTLDKSAGGAFTRAEPPGYVRSCDSCPDNAYVPSSQPLEVSPLFLFNYGDEATATVSETLFGDSPDTFTPIVSESSETAPASGQGPLSVYYGHNTVLVRPTK